MCNTCTFSLKSYTKICFENRISTANKNIINMLLWLTFLLWILNLIIIDKYLLCFGIKFIQRYQNLVFFFSSCSIYGLLDTLFWYRNILSTFWVVTMRLTRRAPFSYCVCAWTRFCGLSVPSCRTCRRSCTRDCRSRTRRSASVWPATQTQHRWGHPQIIISHVICTSYKVLNKTQCGKGFFSYLRNILGFIQDLNGYL